ncbi:MAG: Gfo/Idh/MocA family oxidoreductase [Defluviitaleaceae bacterium]|nr:Gfo/Idh/MocA family oxidoreductase [Defluviitaleaceae bacterium]MCL2274356.1 Gfo/Idh/MocA family oxidoreductase [Defluviitaleaceae bacterium]
MKKTAILIGAGQRGVIYADYALTHPQDLEIVGVAEPDETRREQFRIKHNLPAEACFASWQDVFTRDKWADAVMICTQDTMHYEPFMQAVEKGYDMLLEKPLSPSERECIEMAEAAAKAGVKIVVCHVLRYTPLFAQVKQMITDGAIGDVVTFVHNENVGDIHHSHSFTRGNWRNTKESSPMILQKSCHDMDIIQWLVDKKCISLSSYGALTYFNAKNKPANAPLRCTDGCTENCPYDARKLYVQSENEWFRGVAAGKANPSNAEVEESIKKGPYGRCVFQCDNDVVDHQVVNLSFEDGVTVIFSMTSFTPETSRSFKIMGTKGQIKAHTQNQMIHHTDFITREEKEIPVNRVDNSGHDGGDLGIMQNFCKYLRGEIDASEVSEIAVSAQNHRLSFKAEESRLAGGKCIAL